MDKWADYLISAVRYNEEETHIDVVHCHKAKGETIGKYREMSRDEVIDLIHSGHSFVTILKSRDSQEWVKGRHVHIYHLHGEEFIRTDANKIRTDDLESLPRF